MKAWTTSTPAAISRSQPKISMETTVAATDRTIARIPSNTRPMPKARNQPQLWEISAGIRISRAGISVMALCPHHARGFALGMARLRQRRLQAWQPWPHAQQYGGNYLH